MKERRRKPLAILLILALLVSLCACADPAPAETSSVESGPSSQPAPEPVFEPDPAPAPDPRATEDDGSEEAEEDAADIAEEDSRPNTGDLENPEIWWGEVVEKNIEPPYDIHPMKPYVTEIFEQLYLQDEALTGLTPRYGGYHTDDNSAPTHLTARWPYINDAGEEVTWRIIECSVKQEADGSYSLTLLSFEEYIWE